MAPTALRLVPPIIEEGQLESFKAQNRTINAILSPRSNGLAIYQSVNSLPPPQGARLSGKDATSIYFAQWDLLPQSRRQFISDTYLIFETLRFEVERIPRSSSRKHSNALIEFCNMQCGFYLDVMRKLLTNYGTILSHRPEDLELARENLVLEAVYTSLSLLQTIFLPAHGTFNAIVGRELLHWLNSNFLTSMEEEGTKLLHIEAAWTHPEFWGFIKSCIIRLVFRPVTHFLSRMANSHNSPATKEIAELISTALNGMPSSEDYEQEMDYFDAHRQWKISLHRLNRAIQKHSNARYEGKVDLEEIARLINGDVEALRQICLSCGLSWRDALCVYGIWVQHNMTRQDLADIAAEIVEDMPLDPTNPEDLLHFALFRKDLIKAASVANDLDVWLVAHMLDLLEALDLPEAPLIANLRQYFIIAYAEHLMSDPSMWAIVVSYLRFCGPIAREVAKQYLLRLHFDIPSTGSREIVPSGAKGEPRLATLNAVLAKCQELGFRDTELEICRVAARKLTTLRQYGEAVQFCARNNDTEALNRVVSALLNEYLVNGPREFVLLVDQIPTELMYPAENLPNDRKIFCIRLAFTVAYAEFHFAVSSNNKDARVGEELEELLEESGPQAPKTWWGLILVDLGDFLAQDEAKISSKHMALALARLEEIFIRSKHGAGADYLWALMRRYNMKTEAEALQRLERVRFTMIHSAATSMISEVGGTGSIVEN
ncbi:hypothetical protein CPB86DRAFT_828365 [Serendipita vermifera]|nr:hypothetical protein CPB86DRAFT_828365 [Serendipita vermifera]